MTLPEVLLWRALKGRNLDGLKFRRQQPIGPYFLDFYCPAIRLGVEVDGEGHSWGQRPEYDARRDRWIANAGVQVVRLRAALVLEDVQSAVATIRAAIHDRL